MTLDARNNDFWSELCGTHAAKRLGVNDRSYESIKKFDDWYLNFYPYLTKFLPENVENKRVLEIGLGYGTVSSYLMERGADYTGLDVALGPVEMNIHRAQLLNIRAESVQGSVLCAPFESDTFDYVVAIGCLHHTGDLPKAISEVMRVLKPGGTAYIMVYNSLSYRQLLSNPLASLRSMFRPNSMPRLNSVNDTRYDANLEGEAAPETVYVKKSELAYMVGTENVVSLNTQNIGIGGYSSLMLAIRNVALKIFGRFVGLDIYMIAQKP